METTVNDGSSEEDKLVKCIAENYRGRHKHVVLPKRNVLEAIDVILQAKKIDKKVKPDKPVRATKVGTLCVDRSHLAIHETRFSYRKNGNTLLPILNEMRHCLLTGDWENYKELLLMMFKCSMLTGDYMLYCVRSCFVLLLNHPNRTPELLDNFMEACLCINEETRRLQYLRDCFTLKGNPACTFNENVQDPSDSDEEEEEIFFNSDFSSD